VRRIVKVFESVSVFLMAKNDNMTVTLAVFFAKNGFADYLKN
jgi:hypothetical protein